MVVGVENSNTEHKKVQGQRAKSDLGKAFEGFMSAHRRINRAKAVGRARKKPVSAKKPTAAKKPFNPGPARKPRAR
tara:strand:+ start:628 stop:855 length:228 start_codon:yes stop_codon:yes gene_type:complete